LDFVLGGEIIVGRVLGSGLDRQKHKQLGVANMFQRLLKIVVIHTSCRGHHPLPPLLFRQEAPVPPGHARQHECVENLHGARRCGISQVPVLLRFWGSPKKQRNPKMN
jgi:hypothetical protein